MGFVLLPIAVLAFVLGQLFVAEQAAKSALPNVSVSNVRLDATRFLEYRNQVMAFNAANPACPLAGSWCATNPYPVNVVGSSASFLTYDAFLANAGAYIRPTASGAGRVVTVYATLAPGAITAVLELSENDYSCGLVSGSNWTSAANGSIQTPVSIGFASPAITGSTHGYSTGDVICVSQIGG